MYRVIDTWTLYREEREEVDECNDCVVRAIAAFRDISYQSSRRWCRRVLRRKDRRGPHTTTHMAKAYMDGNLFVRSLTPYHTGHNINWYHYKYITSTCITKDIPYEGHINSVEDIRPKGVKYLTLARFVKDVAEPNGRYLILVRGHAVAVVDRVVYDNVESRKASRIQMVWKL